MEYNDSFHDAGDHTDWHDSLHEDHNHLADISSHHDDLGGFQHDMADQTMHTEAHHGLDTTYDHHDDLAAASTAEVSEWHYPHFDPTLADIHVIGNPLPDMSAWHEQQHRDTCAVVAQEFVLDSFGLHLSENELQQQALAHGWYIPNGGTPLDHVGDLISYYGIPTEHHAGATMSEMANALTQGQKVIVAINAEDIWYHNSPSDPLTAYPGIPGQSADHAVEVIGIDMHDPDHPQVIINDPGIQDGRGIEVPIATFEQSWAASDNFMMSTTSTFTANMSAQTQFTSYPLLGDAQSDADQKDWDAKQDAWKADWADWQAKQEAWKADWAEWEAKRS